MTRLVLVRHGETGWHSENRYAGRSDVDLSPRGVRQAAGLAAWAQAAGLVGIWSSPLTRAHRTARACADRAELELHLDVRLRELDFGQGEGLTAEELEQRFPGARQAFNVDPVAWHLPGGEDPRQAAHRFSGCLAEIAAEHPDGRALVVAHNTVIRLALCELIGTSLQKYRDLFPALHNCALTEIGLRDGQVSLLQFNSPIGPEVPGS